MKGRPKKAGVPLPPNRKKPKAKGPANDALSLLWEWHAANGRTLEGAPEGLLRNAVVHIQSRIKQLTSQAESSRIRTQTKWLKGWLDRAIQQLPAEKRRTA